ncbi:Imm47 family immunity protein [Paenibacillus glacialis]|nr:Imm47 family immunity protein [Paenibacillus glacialis]
MAQSDNLMPSIWYGEKNSSGDISLLKESITKITTEKQCVLLINDLLKLGDFTAKSLLIQLLNTATDENVMNLCIRLFCSVASHQDLLNNENLLFLSNVSEDNADTFASCALYTLSYDATPYLLAMLEEWEDTNVEETIRNTLDIMLNYSDTLDEKAPVDEIGNLYLDYIKGINNDKYYYYMEPVFPGELAKKLVEKAAISLKNKDMIKTNVIPSLLSVWSGIKSPVEYNTIVTDEKFKDVLNYVNVLSKMDWKIGGKYFYGYLINE